VLFAILIVNTFIGILPRPWLAVELIVVLAAIFGMLQSLIVIAYSHPLAPRATGRNWVQTPASPRFWLLFLALLLAPVGVLLFPAVWNQSHGWAVTWGVGGVVCAVVAYFAGRPWPAYK
jgi:hypothetical protein